MNITDDIGVFSIIKAWMFDLYIMRSDFFTSTYNNKKVCRVDFSVYKTYNSRKPYIARCGTFLCLCL